MKTKYINFKQVLCLLITFFFIAHTHSQTWENSTINLSPTDNAVNIDANTKLKIEFSDSIVALQGNLIIRSGSSLNEWNDTIDLSSERINRVDAKTIEMTPFEPLPESDAYYITIDSNAFGEGYKGIAETNDWNFSTNWHGRELLYSKDVDDVFHIHYLLLENYHPDSIYPVVYVLDATPMFIEGSDNYGFFHQIKELMKWKNIPEIITIGIGYDESEFRKRARDFRDNPADFYSFLSQQLLPYIDSLYPIDTNDRSLMGYSYGGYFSSFVLMQYHETEKRLFKNIRIGDPSLHIQGEHNIFTMENQYHENAGDMPVNVVLVSPEDVKAGNMFWADSLNKVLLNRNYNNLKLKYLKIPSTNHLTAISSSNEEGIHWFFNHEKGYIRSTSKQWSTINKNVDDPIFDLNGMMIPKGGIYSGNGITNNAFNPQTAGVGEHLITYSLSNDSIQNSRVFKVVVEPEGTIPMRHIEANLSKIKVDGDFSDWDMLDSHSFIIDDGNSNWNNNSDLSGYFKVAFDSARFYILLEITDDFAVVTGDPLITEDNMEWLMDNIEVYFDMDNSKLPYQNKDYQFRILRGSNSSSKIYQKADQNGYTIEVAYSWDELTKNDNTLDPSDFNNDSIFGFALQVYDRDDFDRSRPTKMTSIKDHFWHDPSTWGTVTLKGEVEHVVETGINIASTNSEDYTIYPNPAHNIIHLAGLGKVNSNIPYKILDVAGKIVQSGHAEAGTIHVSSLESGMYLLKVDSRDFYKKLTIKK